MHDDVRTHCFSTVSRRLVLHAWEWKFNKYVHQELELNLFDIALHIKKG